MKWLCIIFCVAFIAFGGVKVEHHVIVEVNAKYVVESILNFFRFRSRSKPDDNNKRIPQS